MSEEIKHLDEYVVAYIDILGAKEKCLVVTAVPF
jgi:hypothetical protein